MTFRARPNSASKARSLEFRTLFESMQSEFASRVTSVADVFELVRPGDSPELPRYLLTLDAVERYRGMQPRGALRLCDLGGYFGVLAAAIRRLGYEVDVVDHYEPLIGDEAHADIRAWWDDKELRIHDMDLQQPALRLPFEDASVDVVLLLAVIEHLPHTPRILFREIRRIIRSGGLLIVDTPNAGALGTRIGFLLHGEGLWASAGDLFDSEIPFLGHSRCYSQKELTEVLRWSQFVPGETVMLDLAPITHSGSLRARVLYDLGYPLLAKWFAGLRGYIWISARPA